MPARPRASIALAAALLGFSVITLDAVIVDVVLPSIQRDLGGGVTGLAWVVDGYPLLFAALLLSAGSLTDRIGPRRAFGCGMALAGLLVLVGVGGPAATGVFTTSRQLGGALAVAVLGALLADPDTFLAGVRTSLLIAAVTIVAGLLLRGRSTPEEHR